MIVIQRVFFALLTALSAGSCFAQGSLSLTNGEGKFVGWLLGKIPQTQNIQLLTPQGFVLTISGGGFIGNSMNVTVSRVLYEQAPCPEEPCDRNPCGGQAYIEPEPLVALRGEILQLGDYTGDVFVAMPWQPNGGIAELLTLVGEKGADGACVELTTPPTEIQAMWQVNEIDPADFGIRKIDPYPFWAIPGPQTYAIERPDGVFCSGFEGCGNP